jgi:hypothetical protein
VLVDSADSGWLRLVAEPADYTHWYTIAGGAWILAILFVARDLRARKARPRRSWTASGLPVRIAPDSAGFAILPADGSTVVLGFVDLALDDKEADDRLSAAFDLLDDDDEAPVAVRREWARVLDRYRGGALYIGDLVEGEWPTLRIGDTILRSAKPFRAPRRTPWSTEELDEAPDATGNPFLREAVAAPTIAPVQDIPPLPFSVPREPIPWWAQPALAGVLIVGPVVAWLSVFVWDDRSFAVVVSVVGLSAMHRLADMVLSRVVVSADEVRIRTGTTEKVYSWRNVSSVELDGDRITLQLDDGWQEINGLARGRTAQAAAIFEALRLKARHNQQTSRRRRLNPWQVVEGVYLATCAVAVLNDLFG